MATVLVKQLIEAGVHFGHRASRWNPKMRPYIYARQNLIHIIDVRETIRGLLRAKKYLKQVAAGGSLVLFVGTKRQAGETIEREGERCGMPYVSDRWLGGTLTNFRTIRSRLTRLEELEALRSGDEIGAYSKKMQSALQREYRKMYRNLHGMRTMNRLPECLVVIDPEERTQRDPRSPEAGHHHRGADRHRQRSRRGRSADSGQRRQHSLDRVDRASNWPTRSWKARRARRPKMERQKSDVSERTAGRLSRLLRRRSPATRTPHEARHRGRHVRIRHSGRIRRDNHAVAGSANTTFV